MKNLLRNTACLSVAMTSLASPAFAGTPKPWAIGWAPSMALPTDSLWFAVGAAALLGVVVTRLVRAARG